MDGDTTVAYLREIDPLKRRPACFSHQSLASPNDVAEPIRFPRGSQIFHMTGAWIGCGRI